MVRLRNLGPDVSLYYPEGDVRSQLVAHGEVIEVPGTVAKPPTKKAVEEGSAQPLPDDAIVIGDRAWPTSRWELVDTKKSTDGDAAAVEEG